jgi:hypothetical protein
MGSLRFQSNPPPSQSWRNDGDTSVDAEAAVTEATAASGGVPLSEDGFFNFYWIDALEDYNKVRSK